jgi:hypothetical protein
MPTARLVPWVVRLTWVVLPFTAGPTLAAALHDASTPVQIVASVELWAVWALVLLGTLAPRPAGLTALRIAAPAALAATIVAAFADHPSALAVGTAALVTVVAFLPEAALPFVNGTAYPNERRLPLRVPGALLLGVLPIAWIAVVVGVSAGPLLLAARMWVLGFVATAAGIPAAFVLVRALDGLSRRWVVFVPAGVVLHDSMTLADPVLFPRPMVVSLGPAPADTEALDLTQRAYGLALELDLSEPALLVLSRPGGKIGESVLCRQLLFSPTRPGAVIAEARTRRVGV